MSMEFVDGVRKNSRVLAAIAGPTGSGKTLSSFFAAKGLSGDEPFVVIDTERGRALDYADQFKFKYAELEEPFSPQRYYDAIEAAEALNPPCIVVDSGSHEHAGIGGVLDGHETELQRLAGSDYKKREAMKFAAWVKPKAEHKKFVARLIRCRCHVIVCLRAEEKIDLVKDPETGKLTVVPKRTLAGHVGWIPVCGKDLPYEFTLSLVVTPDAPGVPQPIKLPEYLKPFVPLDAPLSEDTGRALAEWARGGKAKRTGGRAPTVPDCKQLAEQLVGLLAAREIEVPRDQIAEKAAAGDASWFNRQIARLEGETAEVGAA